MGVIIIMKLYEFYFGITVFIYFSGEWFQLSARLRDTRKFHRWENLSSTQCMRVAPADLCRFLSHKAKWVIRVFDHKPKFFEPKCGHCNAWFRNKLPCVHVQGMIHFILPIYSIPTCSLYCCLQQYPINYGFCDRVVEWPSLCPSGGTKQSVSELVELYD